MGQPIPASIGTKGTPPAGDQANAVISGTFTAAGQVSLPFGMWGAFNVTIWQSVTETLTLYGAGAAAQATLSPLVGLANGQSLKSVLVPAGATVAAFTTMVPTISLGGLSNTQIAALVAGVDAAAVVAGIGLAGSATIDLEKTFDGGSTWVVAGIGGAGQPASYVFGGAGITNPLSIVVSEPEKNVGYRLNCKAFGAGSTFNYRISTTGQAATAWGVPGI